VLTGVEPDHRIAREEAFGPLLSVIEVDDLDRAGADERFEDFTEIAATAAAAAAGSSNSTS